MTEFNDTVILFSLFGTLSIGLTLYIIKTVNGLCTRISRIEGFMSKHE